MELLGRARTHPVDSGNRTLGITVTALPYGLPPALALPDSGCPSIPAPTGHRLLPGEGKKTRRTHCGTRPGCGVCGAPNKSESDPTAVGAPSNPVRPAPARAGDLGVVHAYKVAPPRAHPSAPLLRLGDSTRVVTVGGRAEASIARGGRGCRRRRVRPLHVTE